MKKSRFTEEQIMYALRRAEGGTPVAGVCRQRGIQFDFTRPGKPMYNRHIESFHGRLRDEHLNVNQFPSIEDAKAKIEASRSKRCFFSLIVPQPSHGQGTKA